MPTRTRAGRDSRKDVSPNPSASDRGAAEGVQPCVPTVRRGEELGRPRRGREPEGGKARAWGRRPEFRDVAACLAAYLYGSIPFVYLLGRAARVDLRRVGSGNVGATNLWVARGSWLPALGWIGDASKGFLPGALARRLGRSRVVADMASVCGVAGQCWPVFLGFSGGRGISAFVGAALWLNPRAWGPALMPLIVGGLWHAEPMLGQRWRRTRRRLRRGRGQSVPLGCLLGVLSFPFWSRALPRHDGGRPILAPALLAGVIVVRRLTALQPDDAASGPRVRPAALLFRLLYDRNTSL